MIHDKYDLKPNGRSMQVYFQKEMATDTLVPFEPGDRCCVFVVPHMGFLLLAPHAVDFPLEIDDPRKLDNGHAPEDVVDPLLRPPLD